MREKQNIKANEGRKIWNKKLKGAFSLALPPSGPVPGKTVLPHRRASPSLPAYLQQHNLKELKRRSGSGRHPAALSGGIAKQLLVRLRPPPMGRMVQGVSGRRDGPVLGS